MEKYINKISKIFAAFAVLALLLSSCSIDDSVNVDPNAIAETKVKSLDGVYSLFVALQVNVADTYTRDRSRLASIWSWQMCAPPGIARPQPVAWNSYNITTDGPTDDYWIITYRGVKIANDIITFTPEVFTGVNEKLGNTILGITKVYKAILLGEAAASFGSIPVEIKGAEAPDFVDQNAAYAYVQKLLDEAIADLNKGTAALTRDLNHKGDAAKWIAVANSVKARYYLHIGDYNNALASANKGIADAAGSIYGIFSANAGEKANWGMWVLNEQEPIRPDKYFLDMFDAKDKRLAEYFNPNADGEFIGFASRPLANAYTKPILDKEKNFQTTVRMKKYSTYAEKFPIIRYEENVLIKAECLARTGTLNDAATQINIIRAKAGLADFTPANKDEAIKEALTQKFLELYLEGQSWHDQRRTGTLPEYKAGANARFLYGQSEKVASTKVPLDKDDLCKYLLNKKYGGLVD